jgi:hypothetical protein
MANTAILTPAQIAEAMAILDRVKAEAAEQAKAEPTPKIPAGLRPSDFVGSAAQPLSEADVNKLVQGWRDAYTAYDDPEVIELLEAKLAAALKADKLSVPPEPPEDRLRRRLRAYMQGSG